MLSKKDITKQLEYYDTVYWNSIYTLCDKVRKEYIIPFCEKMEYDFIAGNGIYLFVETINPSIHITEFDLPMSLYDILEINVGRSNSIGSLIEDYHSSMGSDSKYHS